MATVGIIGLGLMGTKCSEFLIKCGLSVYGYDVFPDAMGKAAENGVTIISTPAELAAKTKNLSINNTSFSQGDYCARQMA